MRKLTTEHLERCMTPQQDDYSCGPACLATIARLSGVERDLTFFRNLLSPRPFIGSHPHAMLEAASRYLPFANVGEGIYKGGLAVGYIIHPEDQVDHYVVFLARQKNRIIYYDPSDHDIYNQDIRKMELYSTFPWSGIDRPLREWTLTFKPVKGLSFSFCQPLASDPLRSFSNDWASVSLLRSWF